MSIGELVVVLGLLFEAGEFGFQRGHDLGMCGAVVDVVKLVGVGAEIETFPLILFPEVDLFVGGGSDAVMSARIVITGVVIVAVVHARAPIGRGLTFQDRE